MTLRQLIASISLLALTACSGGSTQGEEAEVISIAHLKSLCRGDHHRITKEYIVEGVLVANDTMGEFHKSIVVTDESGGIEIAIDSHDMAIELPVYAKVEIQCSGLMLARIGGKIALGADSNEEFPLANIDASMIGRYIRVVGYDHDFEVRTATFAQLDQSDISALLRFDGLHICEEERGLAWCDIIEDEAVTTFRTFVDSNGNTIAVRTLPTVIYALEEIPENEISVIAVVDYSDNRYFLRIANKWIIQ